MRVHRYCFAGLLAILLAPSARAQLPAVWGQAGFGPAAGSMPLYIKERYHLYGDASVGVRLRGAVGVEATLSDFFSQGDVISNAVCIVSITNPNVCLPLNASQHFSMTGISVSGVVQWRAEDRPFGGHLAIGVGDYVLASTSYRPSTGAAAIDARLSLSVLTMRSFGLALFAREIYVPNVRGSVVWATPYGLSLRVW